jgi:putative acetyltransferase
MDAAPSLWRIEPAPPDAPDSRALIAGSEAELAALYPPEERFALSPEALVAAGARFFLARDPATDEALACLGLAVLRDPDGRPYGELKRLFAAPAARRRGAAKALIRHVESEARALALPLLRLETGPANAAALALYASLGYRRRGPFGDYAASGSSIFMENPMGEDPAP